MKQKYIWLLTPLLTFALLTPAHADNIDSLKNDIDEKKEDITTLEKEKKVVEKEIDSLETQIKKITKTIETIEQTITQTEEDIAALTSEIEALKKEIKKTEIELQQKKDILAENVRILYSKGDVSFMEYLFRSDDVSDFLFRFDTIKNIAKANRTLYDEVQAYAEKLAAQKQKLDDKKKALEEKKRSLDALKKENEENKKKQQALLKKAEKEHQTIQSEINTQEAAIQHINAKIQKIIAEREAERKRREAANKPSVAPGEQLGTGQFGLPMARGTYSVSSPFGYRTHPITGSQSLHGGIDMAAPVGTPIYASDSGTVLYSGPASGFGNWIVIDHNNGYLTVYGHMYANQLYVGVGAQVKRGQKIAGVGSAGGSTGAHLHFEIHKGGLYNRLNPANFISF